MSFEAHNQLVGLSTARSSSRPEHAAEASTTVDEVLARTADDLLTPEMDELKRVVESDATPRASAASLSPGADSPCRPRRTIS
ncbi:hypothetical protein ABZ345_14590 [Lentzea sp. NPDC005914]|uniref:hypothetical protein n=1 Tax=Lentzea sp. NPDC005914 TaxID=3154572 RepID=UPI0033CEC4ED